VSDRLAIFDIDGTLTRTSEVDDECYIRAVREEWGVSSMSTDWSAYEHSTDNAIAAEIFRRARGREASPAELASLRDRFAQLVASEASCAPERFRPIVGADAIVEELPHFGWAVAIATGGWTPSARTKLATAGIPAEGIPAAFACDARPRQDIIAIAAARAAERCGVRGFRRVVYLGDGVWDARACAAVGIPFVGIAQGARAERLREEGASVVLPDYADVALVRRALEEAAVPAPRRETGTLA
jgi:phosphoglycolate phosphatase-like HAD superfamily hydrolase